jgi:hypothetical protein
MYIFANPSFKADWVKIGKSSRETEVRSKKMDKLAEFQKIPGGNGK